VCEHAGVAEAVGIVETVTVSMRRYLLAHHRERSAMQCLPDGAVRLMAAYRPELGSPGS
jgi:hypothetical protein